MLKELLYQLAYPLFKKDMEELQRYRNTVYGIHRWCASNKVADLITTQIIEVAKDNICHDDHVFRIKLSEIPIECKLPNEMFHLHLLTVPLIECKNSIRGKGVITPGMAARILEDWDNARGLPQ